MYRPKSHSNLLPEHGEPLAILPSMRPKPVRVATSYQGVSRVEEQFRLARARQPFIRVIPPQQNVVILGVMLQHCLYRIPPRLGHVTEDPTIFRLPGKFHLRPGFIIDLLTAAHSWPWDIQ